jgi:hypothetical protein
MFADDPTVIRELNSEEPLKVKGLSAAPKNRETLWKNLCAIGWNQAECILEFSRSEHKFYIIAWEIQQNKFHTIELFRSQANKLLHVCDSDLEKVMRLLDFQNGKLIVKNFEIIMQYEAFMPSKAA